MPIYEYQCLECGHHFEKIVFNNNTTISCPGCGAEKAEKKLSLFSSPGIKKSAGGKTACASCTSKNCASCG